MILIADIAPQVEFAVAFLGTLLARAVAAPLNQNYHEVSGLVVVLLRDCAGFDHVCFWLVTVYTVCVE